MRSNLTSKNPLVSIVIRAKNEEKYINELLHKLQNQTFEDFEIIVVDNESSDNTLQIAKKFKVDKIIHISDEDFSHPYSTNLGVEAAVGKFVVLTNGHCVPMTNTWIANGLKNFNNPKVAGIDGHYIIGKAATPFQKLRDLVYLPQTKLRIEGKHVSTTNCIIRKDLWELYPFDETLEECEDYDWSKEMIARGYKIIKDPKFNVYHYHPLTREQFYARHKKWKRICTLIDKRARPRKSFTRLSRAST
ncbi:MAG: glycosyltransferase [Patescibacteria group bacterium]